MKDNKLKKRRFIAEAIIIAALYVLLTMISDLFGMATGPLRFRISEALCVLTYYTGAAVPGLFVGSFISNALFAFKGASEVAYVIPPSTMLDVLFASLTTLVAAIISFCIRKSKWFVPAPNIILTMFSVPYIYIYVRRFEDYSFWKYFFMTGIGEVVTTGLLGIALLLALEDYKEKLFPRSNIIIKPSDDLNANVIVASDSNLPKEENVVEEAKAVADVSEAKQDLEK